MPTTRSANLGESCPPSRCILSMFSPPFLCSVTVVVLRPVWCQLVTHRDVSMCSDQRILIGLRDLWVLERVQHGVHAREEKCLRGVSLRIRLDDLGVVKLTVRIHADTVRVVQNVLQVPHSNVVFCSHLF